MKEIYLLWMLFVEWDCSILNLLIDLPDYIKHSQIRLFADDSIIYRFFKTQADCIKLWMLFVEWDCSILNLLIV
jgi:hypothetical protein